jgi:regulator of protease activity HflC (stomatin/prohibitin superfamily)
MFDRIFDFIADAWEWLIPWVIIDQYEQGVVLRLGKFKRAVNPGLRFIWPFGIEDVKYETVVRQTAYLDPQSITTQDGKSVTVAAIVIFTISDIRKFLLDIDEGETDMCNMVYGIISDAIESTNWKDVVSVEFNGKVLENAQKDCNDYCGVNVIAVKWSDKATARNLRLWND